MSACRLWCGAVMGLGLVHAAAEAQVPALIHYQGRLLNGTNLYNGSISLGLAIHTNASGGVALCVDSNPAVPVVDGLYSTFIGDDVVSGSLTSALATGAAYIEVTVNGTPLAPRERIGSVAFALRAAEAPGGGSGGTAGWSLTGNAGIAPSQFLGTTDTAPLELRVNNARVGLFRPDAPSPTVVLGNAVNASYAQGSAILGGGGNSVGPTSAYAVVVGGRLNMIGTNAPSSVIGGGTNNAVADGMGPAVVIGGGDSNLIIGQSNDLFRWFFGAPRSVICGGQSNLVKGGDGAVIGGGRLNTVVGNIFLDFPCDSAVLGGFGNHAEGHASAIGGGSENQILADFAAIPGGDRNKVFGSWSFAAGRRAVANHAGSFVWGDSTDADVSSVADNHFTVRCTGGAKFYTSTGTTGPYLDAGGTSWKTSSDRNLKENFREVNTVEVLQRVAELPITQWNYRGSDPSVVHIGPMAQDFHAAFGLGGTDDKGIGTLDAEGVALAAIQGVARRLEEKDREIADLRRQLEELRREMRAARPAEARTDAEAR